MSYRVYVCITHNKNWRIGQYFIVDEERTEAKAAKAIIAGERSKTKIVPSGMGLVIPFSQIEPFVREVPTNKLLED